MKEEVLNAAFVKAWNNLIFNKEKHLIRWMEMLKEGNSLEKLRVRQLMELVEQPPLTVVVPELVQLVLERVEIKKGGEFVFIL